MPRLRIAFRADASTAIGSGHVMRCLTLADFLRERGAEVTFISRELPGNLIPFVESKGFAVHRLTSPVRRDFSAANIYAEWLGVPWQADADEVVTILGRLQRHDWLIVDNYALDIRWEQQMRPHAGRIMVIDDLADRAHDCDLLLDQNLYADMTTRYEGLVPVGCISLLGPRHALLRPEFVGLRQNLRNRDGKIRRILIFFGGSDPGDETGKALTAVEAAGLDVWVDVVVGSANPHRKEIQERCGQLHGCLFHCQIDNMAELMSLADLAIGAGGATTWERCALGLPAIVLVIADNQYETTKAVAATGATLCLGRCEEVDSESLAAALRQLSGNPSLVKQMGKNALEVMTQGGTTRTDALVDAILGNAHAA